jgi:hypothetical protein
MCRLNVTILFSNYFLPRLKLTHLDIALSKECKKNSNNYHILLIIISFQFSFRYVHTGRLVFGSFGQTEIFVDFATFA